MLTLSAILPLIIPLASAAVIAQSQQLLASNVTNLTDVLNVKKFAIEDMSAAAFRIHHMAAKALLGDSSYIALRNAEINQREQDIWQSVWKHELRCHDWGMDTEDRPLFEQRPKLWFSDDRVFDVDPAHVPQEAITALKGLAEKERKNRRDMRLQRMCNTTQTVDKGSMAMSSAPSGVFEDDWHITIPDEYMQYLIPQGVIEEEDRLMEKLWTEQDELNKKKILAGTRSVRDMKMLDLSKCTKRERRERHVFWED